jgi:hypothetical protein
MSTDDRTSQASESASVLATSILTSTPTEVSVYTWYNEVHGIMRPCGAFRGLPGTRESNQTFSESVFEDVVANGVATL